MIRRRSILALVVLATAACNSLDNSTPRGNYAIVFADAFNTTAGYRLSPTVAFFSSPQLSFNTSVYSADTCVVTTYDANANDNLSGITYLDAGAAVTAQIGDTTRTLTRSTATDGTQTYKITTGSAFAFTPGDSLQVTVPGATSGFSPFVIKGRTAEAFTASEPTPPAAGEPLTLTWSAAPAVGSTMLVSLRYASPSSSGGALDRQIYCDLVDDGSYAIAPSLITDWRVATTRSYVFTRWRTEIKQVNSSSVAILTSTFSVPTPGSQPTLARAVKPIGGF